MYFNNVDSVVYTLSTLTRHPTIPLSFQGTFPIYKPSHPSENLNRMELPLRFLATLHAIILWLSSRVLSSRLALQSFIDSSMPRMLVVQQRCYLITIDSDSS